MIASLKKIIPLSWKTRIILWTWMRKSPDEFSFKVPDPKKRRIFIFLAADYGNLGDVAITFAQHKFLSNICTDSIVTEIPIKFSIQGVAFVKKVIKKGDIVTTVGGGNMGDLYPSIEHYRRMVISHFKNNQIISFPQTIDFNTSNSKGKAALNKSVKVYSRHPNLTLIAREHKSYEFFKQHFVKNIILLTPDIVLSLNQSKPKYSRKGALICLRDDKEKKLTKNQEKSLEELLVEKFKKVNFRDTHVGGFGLPLKNRVGKLKLIWDDFRKAELVITDRLHGMIFCYITATPALVFLNNNHKIKSSYFWIKTAPHIKLIENFSIDNIEKSMEDIIGVDANIDDSNLISKYDAIVNIIKKQ